MKGGTLHGWLILSSKPPAPVAPPSKQTLWPGVAPPPAPPLGRRTSPPTYRSTGRRWVSRSVPSLAASSSTTRPRPTMALGARRAQTLIPAAAAAVSQRRAAAARGRNPAPRPACERGGGGGAAAGPLLPARLPTYPPACLHGSDHLGLADFHPRAWLGAGGAGAKPPS